MAISRLVLILLAAMAIKAGAQQEGAPSLQDGPLQIPPAKTSSPVQLPQANPGTDSNDSNKPLPDSNGVYEPGPGIELPRLIDATPITYPPDAPLAAAPRVCVVSVVVGVDGALSGVKVVRPLIPEVDRVVSDAVAKLHFEPGTLDGKPVPVRIDVSLHFSSNSDSAIPRVLHKQPMGMGGASKLYDVPPKPIHTVEAEFSDQARRERKSGSVTVSLVVDTDGMPTEIHVVRGAGYGLDEKAMEAVSQYRFKPAMKDGKPVAAPISVQVSFRLYSRPN
jgi:TonB family protein